MAGEKPDFYVTAKVNGDKRNWTRIGSAWNTVSRNGVPYISVRLQSVPLNWDGAMALHEATNGDPSPPED